MINCCAKFIFVQSLVCWERRTQKDKYGKGNKKVCKIVERHTGHQFLHGPETSPKGLQNIAK
jgi:hypothetical protein